MNEEIGFEENGLIGPIFAHGQKSINVGRDRFLRKWPNWPIFARFGAHRQKSQKVG